MLRITFITLALCAITLLNAQVPNANFKVGLMLSNESSFARQPQQDYYIDGRLQRQYSSRTNDPIQLVPSLMWQTKKGNFMTVSVPRFRVRNQTTSVMDSSGTLAYGLKVVDEEFAVRYAYSIRFLKQKSQNWLPMLSFEATPYLRRHLESPLTTTLFPVAESYVGLQGSIRPHIVWLPSEHLFLDLGASYNLFDFYSGHRTTADPSVSIESRNSGITSYMGLPGQFGFQIGAGLRL